MYEALSQHPWLLGLTLLSLGLVVGSFLNVVAYRLPKMMEASWRAECREFLELPEEDPGEPLTLSKPGSHCPHCNTPIKPWHNVPVLGWLLLGGKCAQCKASISPRYPIVEAITGGLTLALMCSFALSPALAAAAGLTWVLVALTLIDLDHQLLPDNLTLPLMWAGLALNTQGIFTDLHSAVLGAMFGYLSLWSVYWLFKLLTGKEGMGYGDFKLLAALGAWLGWQSLPLIILLSSVVGAVVGIGLMLAKSRGREVPIPFGPYLATAGWIYLMWGDTISSTYLGAIGASS